MLISEYHRGCVVFLSQPGAGGSQVPKGTGFIVTEKTSSDEEVNQAHLVTARHVVEAARATGNTLHIRGSDAEGNVVVSPSLEFSRWHISSSTDVAIYANAPLEKFSGSCLPIDAFANPAYLQKHHIGPGDEVFFVGLFTAHARSNHNEPIVRFGNISMLPREPVEIQNADGSRTPVSAFLVEARSWGGQSGSPAFVWLSPIRHPGVLTLPQIPSDGPLPLDAQPHLLGLVCGHFDIARDISVQTERGLSASVKMNAGVAIVIPAQHIADELAMALAGI